MLGDKICKMFRKIHFFALEVEKTTSGCFSGQNWIFNKNQFFICGKILKIYFSSQSLQALAKNVFFQNLTSRGR